MPELPEVETMVRGVRSTIVGRRIARTEFCRSPRKPITIRPSRPALRRRTEGRVIRSVDRLAKRILITLDSDDVLVIEPRMTGLLLIEQPPTRQHRRLCWHFDRNDAGQVRENNTAPATRACLEFWDQRGLGTITLMTPDEFQTLQQRLGPDALKMTLQRWEAALSRTSRAIKVALLDQALVGGIGNLYASEILHHAGISPLRPASELTADEQAKLHDSVRRILRTAIRYEGSTLNDGTYRNALNKDGSYQNHHRVYARENEPCPRCPSGKIQRIVQAQRSTFYCPLCQE